MEPVTRQCAKDMVGEQGQEGCRFLSVFLFCISENILLSLESNHLKLEKVSCHVTLILELQSDCTTWEKSTYLVPAQITLLKCL